MKLNLEDPARLTGLPPQEEAVRIQNEIDRLKIHMEELAAQRDECVRQALEAGVRQYGGYKFIRKAPASTMSEVKLAELHPAEYDGYIAWFKATREVKLTKTELAKYLKTTDSTDPEKVIEDCTVPGIGGPTYTMARLKGVEE